MIAIKTDRIYARCTTKTREKFEALAFILRLSQGDLLEYLIDGCLDNNEKLAKSIKKICNKRSVDSEE